MSLYEYVLGHLPKSRSVERQALHAATVVDVQNVAEHLIGSPPEPNWNLKTDYPSLAPPWRSAFYEYVIPEGGVPWAPGLVGGTQIGALQLAERFLSPEEGGAEHVLDFAKGMLAQLTSEGLIEKLGRKGAFDLMASGEVNAAGLWDRLTDARRAALLHEATKQIEARFAFSKAIDLLWETSTWIYVAPPGRGPHQPCEISYGVHGDGRVRLTLGYDEEKEERTADPEVKLNPYEVARGGYTPYPGEDCDHGGEITAHAYLSLLVPVFLGISFCHCRNVTVEPRAERVLRPRQARILGLGKIVSHQIRIQPMRRVLAAEGGEQQHGTKRALHICRGHFKDYREHGLFGKRHGLYWWDQQARGSAEVGVVNSGYKVETPGRGR